MLLFLARVQVVHKSEKNLSDKSRYAFTFHVIEGEANYEYVPSTDLLTISRGDLTSASLFFVCESEKNWLQPTKETPFTKLFP